MTHSSEFPDELDRLTTLTPPTAISSGSFGFSYDALSRRTQLTRPNSVNTSYSYDNLSRLLSVLHTLNAATIDGATYTVDAVGNRTVKTNQLNAVTENYGYDAIYQLTGVTQGATTTESYTYDPVGNRLSSLGVSPYSYNSSNQLTSTPTATYTYDNNGNTLTKTEGSNVTTYTWDYENRLTQVSLPGGAAVSFKYDPFGRRVQKASASGATNYAYDGADVAEEVDATGGALARYSHGLDIDEALAMLRDGATSYYEADGLGSVSSLTDPSGTIAASYTYDSFGKAVSSSGTVLNPFRYTGRESDAEVGLYYYRARYYDSITGRFTSEDSIRFAAGVDFYAYTFNNPANDIDPSGEDVQECRRPLKLKGATTPHTFLISTNTRGSWGLTVKNLVGGTVVSAMGKSVPGKIEYEWPYEESGKLKPSYSCVTISKDKCFEDCVNQRGNDARSAPPNYQFGKYQCDTWIEDIRRQCSKECAQVPRGPRTKGKGTK